MAGVGEIAVIAEFSDAAYEADHEKYCQEGQEQVHQDECPRGSAVDPCDHWCAGCGLIEASIEAR